MSNKTTLPMANMKEMNLRYKKTLESMEKLMKHISVLLSEKEDSDYEEPSGEWDYMEEKYQYLKLKVELNELEAKVAIQEYQMKLYQDRLDEYLPIFEEESQKVNMNWERVWESAKREAEKNPVGVFAMIVNGYPEDASQELKNETFKALTKQFDFLLKKKVEN